MILFAWFYAQTATAGTWSALAHRTPVPSGSANGNPTLMLLLSDGTVMVENDPTGGGTGTNWFRLTPDIHGSYANGTWTILTPSTYGRGGCASDVMTNGRVFFAGGEYGTGSNTVEVFDPVSNAWTIVPVPISLLNTNTTQEFSDAISVVVANGDVLVAPVKGAYSHETMLFHPALNSFTAGPNLKSTYQDEASWVKLPDNSILTIDPFGTNSERYIPSLNLWVTDAHVPVALYDGIGELGAGFLLPDGRAFFLGGTGHTAFYTPSGTTNQGVWAAGPDIPAIGTNVQGCPDAPAAMMANGNILVSTGVAGTFSGPIYFFEYDYLSNTFTRIVGPTGGTNFSAAPYYTKMLDLPDGSVLWNWGNPQMYVYKPTGAPVTSGKPVISNIVLNVDGSYHLAGAGLNGISEGAAYGDDAQMASNFPLVRMTNSITGNVYYARTYNWSSTSVMTSNKPVSTEFMLPMGLPAGSYSLVAVANGISSDPLSFTTPFDAPLTPPGIASVQASGPNLVINATNGLTGRIYHILTSTNPAMPRSKWAVVGTNYLSAGGNFTITITNGVNTGEMERFYTLQGQ